jgi:WD40 repeat protein
MRRADELAALERALHAASPPGEGAARERARRTVLAAARPAAAAAPVRRPLLAAVRRRRSRALALLAAALLAIAGGGALTRPGQAVGEWLGSRLVPEAPERLPAPRPLPRRQDGPELPAGGRLLVHSRRGLAIVARDGARTPLGRWTTGAWSPHGWHLAVASGRTLAALTPDGSVRWHRTLPGRVADPRWAPDGTHVAYRAGATEHLIWGNGLDDVALRGGAAATAPAWRPSAPHTLAWARADGTVLVQDADTGLVLWHRRTSPVRQLSWSADGRRLLIAGRRRGAVYDLAAGTSRRLPLAPGEELTAAAFAPRGTRLALAVRDPAAGSTQVRLLGDGSTLVRAPLRLSGIEWSPDSRWLLAGWPVGDQWLLIPASGGPEVRGITEVARRFGAGTRPLGWCCGS